MVISSKKNELNGVLFPRGVLLLKLLSGAGAKLTKCPLGRLLEERVTHSLSEACVQRLGEVSSQWSNSSRPHHAYFYTEAGSFKICIVYCRKNTTLGTTDAATALILELRQLRNRCII